MGGMTFSMRETANPFNDVDEDTAREVCGGIKNPDQTEFLGVSRNCLCSLPELSV
jgi:hypothetical protein